MRGSIGAVQQSSERVSGLLEGEYVKTSDEFFNRYSHYVPSRVTTIRTRCLDDIRPFHCATSLSCILSVCFRFLLEIFCCSGRGSAPGRVPEADEVAGVDG